MDDETESMLVCTQEIFMETIAGDCQILKINQINTPSLQLCQDMTWP